MAKLVSKLGLIARASDEAAAVALHDTAAFILTLIRVYAPVDTGWLRDSYQKESIGPLHVLIGSMVDYAIYQEYGTSRQSGKPHVTPAFHQATGFFKQALAARIKNLG